MWLLAWPDSFAEFAGFEPHQHFGHDLGAFNLGIGTTLLLAVPWTDAAAVTLAGFFVGNTAHTINHVADLDVGGHGRDPWILALGSVLVLAALVLRMRRLGWVAGTVTTTAAVPALAPFVRQKTILLTSYRRDGRAVGAPVSVVVDGDRAYVRSPGAGGKIKRIRNNPLVEIAPSTGSGKVTGPAVRMQAGFLDGAEFRHAGRLLRRKYPVLQGVFVPLLHRLGRAKFGRTVHLVLTPMTGQSAQHQTHAQLGAGTAGTSARSGRA
ncbi:PPOX class F420-dependent oxidoreductase [Plantactinospora sp. KLBMP9567]|uniref:PPOX class F420-dependent oxidoreductase n=1 Tax=Plantactinospora sp. KLBMP9567 TaxID=3085900 RepID=UPI0029815037|nr:PPOX class F420-dependent oxidoreductase [Plantactinospora sp. KLBMP9567]MDW5327139.1 PPOX class F420-dependent oxidoreductase [Plantactinospora sp. KLBMP9567]